jgi:hypothetical protein
MRILEDKAIFSSRYFRVSKKLVKLLFRGLLGLSNDISPSKIGYFPIEIWPKERAHVLIASTVLNHFILPVAKIKSIQSKIYSF